MAGLSATYINTSQFSVVGDKVDEFIIGRRVRCDCGVDGYKYCTIDASASSDGTTLITIDIIYSDAITPNLVSVEYGIVSPLGTGSFPEHNHDGTGGSGGPLLTQLNTLWVSVNGSDVSGTGSLNNPYKTINYTLSQITTNSAFNRFLINIAPGFYYEDPITTKNYVNIQSLGDQYTTSIIANDANSILLTVVGDSIIGGFSIGGTTGASLIYFNAPGRAGVLQNISVYACETGFDIVAGGCTLSNINTIPFPGTSIGTFVKQTSSVSAFVSNGRIIPGSTVGTAFYASGTGVKLQLAVCLVEGNTQNVIYADNGAEINFFGITCSNAVNGLRGNNGSRILGVSPYMDDSVTNHVLIEDLDTDIDIQIGSMNRERFVFPTGYDNETFTGFEDENQELTSALGDYSFGRATHGSVVSIGEGRPYTQGMVVLTTDNSATNTTDGTSFIDVSVIAAAPITDSTASFSFQGVEANHTILIGSEKENSDGTLKVLGFAIRQAQRAIEDAESSFLLEYWNGSQWVERGLMAIQDEFNHAYADKIFIRANSTEILHTRLHDDEQRKTIDGKNLYWVRFRITDDLIQAPTFTQFLLEPSLTRFNGEGIPIFISFARFRQNIFSPNNYGRLGNITSGSAPVGVGASPNGWNHNVSSSIANDINDALHLQFSLPLGLCTSCPINIQVHYRVPTSGVSSAGQMTISFLPVEVAGIRIADPAGGIDPIPRPIATTGSVVSEAAQTSIHAIDYTTNDKVISILSDDFDVDHLYEGDYVFVQIQFDDVGDAGKELIVYGVEVYGVIWKLGGRIDLGYLV